MAEKTLITGISGIRGIFGAGLDAAVLVRYAAAYGTWCKRHTEKRPVVVVGRDARVSGPICARIVIATLQSVGCDVIDAGLAPTPTVAMAVLLERATGGVILSASHNPAEWNALKLLNEHSEFLSADEGREVMQMADEGQVAASTIDDIGGLSRKDYLDAHINSILALDFVDPAKVAAQEFRVLVDGINSVGAIALPRLLERFGIEDIHVLNGDPTGRFAHPAEPLPEHLDSTLAAARELQLDLGLVVDPDADRLALIDDRGDYVSEELTQVMAADFLWQRRKGPFVTNLSSSRAIEDVARRYDMTVYRAAVGEINVVKKMQEVGAVMGGEGNGGVILPDLHYGRDSLVGAAMILQHLAEQGTSMSAYRKTLPTYTISKNKLALGAADPDEILDRLADRYRSSDMSMVDGLKINFTDGWVHLRASNTEPVLRVYAEASTSQEANRLAHAFMREVQVLAAP